FGLFSEQRGSFMTANSNEPVDLAGTEKIVSTTETLVREALAVASRRTDGGKGIDAEQVHCERLAYAATEVRAARDLVGYATAAAEHQTDPSLPAMAALFAAEVALKLR